MIDPELRMFLFGMVTGCFGTIALLIGMTALVAFLERPSAFRGWRPADALHKEKEKDE